MVPSFSIVINHLAVIVCLHVTRRRFGSRDCLRNTIILIAQLWPPGHSKRRLLCEKRLPAFKLRPPVVPELRKCFLLSAALITRKFFCCSPQWPVKQTLQASFSRPSCVLALMEGQALTTCCVETTCCCRWNASSPPGHKRRGSVRQEAILIESSPEYVPGAVPSGGLRECIDLMESSEGTCNSLQQPEDF